MKRPPVAVNRFAALALRISAICLSPAKAQAAEPIPSPSPQQLVWQRHEFIAFAHFGMNTFTDREWGEGNEDPKLFNPTDFDARQWAAVLEDPGVKLLILTAKHPGWMKQVDGTGLTAAVCLCRIPSQRLPLV